MSTEISEAQISALVDDFYTKVRHDPEIGPSSMPSLTIGHTTLLF
jgi:truncated hemoglobin YjbI